MELLTKELLIAYIVLFWLLFLVIYGSQWLNKKVEASNLLTLRLNIRIFGLCSFGIILAAFGVDICYKYGIFWLFPQKFLPDIFYWIFLLGAGLSIFLRYWKFTDHKEIFVVISLITLSLRFVVELEYHDWIYTAALFSFLMLYASFIIRYLDDMSVTRRLLTWLITLIIVTVSCFVLERFVRLNQHYFTYLLVLYLVTIWERYFWHLEYKRRGSCSACGGWGQEGTSGKEKAWWAVGYSKTSGKTNCQTCGGKGWVHRNEKLLHD
ncbi:MAG: hypothetical protein ACPG5B_07500 [Chitinophagales bacterium]